MRVGESVSPCKTGSPYLRFGFLAIGSHGHVGDFVAVLEPPSSIHSAPADKIATHASGRGNFADAETK